jgi:hypothetical protein
MPEATLAGRGRPSRARLPGLAIPRAGGDGSPAPFRGQVNYQYNPRSHLNAGLSCCPHGRAALSTGLRSAAPLADGQSASVDRQAQRKL